MLLEELRAARLRWRPGKHPPKETVAGSHFRSGYGRPDGEVISSRRVTEAIGRIVSSIGREMHVTPFEEGYLLDHLIHVGFRLSLPHARFGGLHWSFAFTGAETEDVILGLGFSPPPIVEHVETIVFRISQFRHRACSVCPLLEPKPGRRLHARFPADVAPVETLRHAIRFRGKRAEERLPGAVRGRATISLEAVADELSWPVESTRSLYRKLEIRGEAVPLLTNGLVGRRLTVTCPHCLRTRSLAPAVVMSLKTDVCFECLHRPPVITPNRLVAECPSCGARRLLTQAQAASRSAGLRTPCRRCSMANGRAAGRARHAKRIAR